MSEVHNSSVATLFEAICQPRGWSYEVTDRGFVLVRRFITKIYPVDYLEIILNRLGMYDYRFVEAVR